MGSAQENIVACFGGGQLGRMLAMAGHRIGINVRCMDPSPDACAGQVGATLFGGSYTDETDVFRFLEGARVATYEFENVPGIVGDFAERKNVPFRPSAQALRIAQDRSNEKQFARGLGCKVPKYAYINGLQDIGPALEAAGLPAILKTRSGGYDGKGQVRIERAIDLFNAVDHMGPGLILEEEVRFRAEWSQISVRGLDGEIAHYPPIENSHKNGILRVSRVDVEPDHRVSPRKVALIREAQRISTAMMLHLDYVGVFTIELFERENFKGDEAAGELLVNEIAPRVHNSGHWTIDAEVTSQFENHLRAILGLKLGATVPRVGYIGMVNLVGMWEEPERLIDTLGSGALHLYGKEHRPGRKIGHYTTAQVSNREAREADIAYLHRQTKFRRAKGKLGEFEGLV